MKKTNKPFWPKFLTGLFLFLILTAVLTVIIMASTVSPEFKKLNTRIAELEKENQNLTQTLQAEPPTCVPPEPEYFGGSQ